MIPTPRTDKNGVTSIRHMKPVSGSAPQRNGFPPATALTGNGGNKQGSVDSLVHLIYGDKSHKPEELSDARWAVGEFQKASPRVAELMGKLLTEGTETGHGVIRERVINTVAMMSAFKTEDESRFEWKLKSIRSAIDEDELRRLWNCGNVMEECGSAENVVIPGRVGRVIEKELPAYYPRTDLTELSDEMLRGVTAFTITDITPARDESLDQKTKTAVEREYCRNAKKFIDYAGSHPDIGLVTRIAMERRTLDVSVIKKIIKDGEKNPSLRDGLL